MLTNRVAASLALPDTDGCLAALCSLAPRIALAEVRLDRMVSLDLPRLIADAPCPLILTCRPPREGGAFPGAESERLEILAHAMELGCAFVDVEWDSLAALEGKRRSRTQIIASRHWLDRMPDDLFQTYQALRGRADVVKLVGMAQRPRDALRILDLLHRAQSPVIGIAMGEAGRLTRILAPCFPSCLLTYGASNPSAVTAAGQLTVTEMIDGYRLHEVTPSTPVHIHLSTSGASAWSPAQRAAGAPLRVSLPLDATDANDAADVVAALYQCLPGLTVTADDDLLPVLGQGHLRGRRG